MYVFNVLEWSIKCMHRAVLVYERMWRRKRNDNNQLHYANDCSDFWSI